MRSLGKGISIDCFGVIEVVSVGVMFVTVGVNL